MVEELSEILGKDFAEEMYWLDDALSECGPVPDEESPDDWRSAIRPFPGKNGYFLQWLAKPADRTKIALNPEENRILGGVSESLWEQEVASSNLAATTFDWLLG